MDTIGFAAFLVSASICLGELGRSPSLGLSLFECTHTRPGAGFSASYHTLIAHSERVAIQWNRLDYVGIVVLISGTFVPLVHYGFYCDPHLRNTYIALIYTFALGECSRHFQLSSTWRSNKLQLTLLYRQDLVLTVLTPNSNNRNGGCASRPYARVPPLPNVGFYRARPERGVSRRTRHRPLWSELCTKFSTAWQRRDSHSHSRERLQLEGASTNISLFWLALGGALYIAGALL